MSTPNKTLLRVGTRGSALALRQTDIAIERLLGVASQEIQVEVVEISTRGDADKTTPFEQLGPKGVFAHELQRALLDGRIDIAVHSAKDLQSTEPDGLVIAAVPEREDARDVLVSRTGQTLAELEPGSVVGTSSARRSALLRLARPDLETAPLRGNVDTRLRKVSDGEVDAAILAAAGIVRLGREDEITEWLDADTFIPPPAQGALAIEARADRVRGDLSWVSGADDATSRACVETERTFMRLIEGSCEVPLGAWARFEDGEIVCDAFVAAPDGSAHMRDSARGVDPEQVGSDLARRMLDAGARELVAQG